MRLYKALLVARKDWKEAFSSRLSLASLVFPYAFAMLVPLLLMALFVLGGPEFAEMTPREVERLRAILPGTEGLTEEQLSIYLVGALIAPLLFLIAPLMSSSMIAADSFAGEKERKTIEPLLAAPVDEAELLLGKVLVSFLPTMALLYASFGLCCALTNALTAGIMGYLWFPPLSTLLSVCLIGPLYTFLGMCLVIVGSTRASTVRDASNYAGVLILPLLAVLLAQLAGLMVVNATYILIAAGILALIDALTFRLAYRAFNREAIITRL